MLFKWNSILAVLALHFSHPLKSRGIVFCYDHLEKHVDAKKYTCLLNTELLGKDKFQTIKKKERGNNNRLCYFNLLLNRYTFKIIKCNKRATFWVRKDKNVYFVPTFIICKSYTIISVGDLNIRGEIRSGLPWILLWWLFGLKFSCLAGTGCECL